jgi:hypothetical protein
MAALRRELAELDNQLNVFDETSEDTLLRAMTSDSPLDVAEHDEHAQHAAVMHRRRAQVQAEIAAVAAEQDRLLDQLGSG